MTVKRKKQVMRERKMKMKKVVMMKKKQRIVTPQKYLG